MAQSSTIGRNSWTDEPNAVGVGLWLRWDDGFLSLLAGLSSTVHPAFETDYNVSPLDHVWINSPNWGLVLEIEQGVFPNHQVFGGIQIWWRRQVSPAPGVASFNDVPTSHPLFQYIEALKSSGITAGCGGGNFCPNEPLTRGQMAVFLAKALGLHWATSYTSPP